MTDQALHERVCTDCKPGTPPLPGSDLDRLIADVDDDWEIKDGTRLVRTASFKNFRQPFAVATEIAMLAENQGHHPDLKIEWGKLTIELTTHVAKGLTENDFIMAAKIDRLLGR